DSGLIYLNTRWYDPSLSRFTRPDKLDPIERGVGPDQYGYAGGDPVNNSDPGGEFFGADDAFAAGIGAAVGAITQAGSDIYNGRLSLFKDYRNEMTAGSIAAVVGYNASIATSPICGAAIGGAAYEISSNILNGENIDIGNVAMAAALGAVTAGVASKFGGVIRSLKANNSKKTKQFGCQILRRMHLM
ncbi:RHS repeat-associated core domain-containing protein, partial [Segnochrobactraceae bacterium EtOH-i3]